jgi:hypothetical protein
LSEKRRSVDRSPGTTRCLFSIQVRQILKDPNWDFTKGAYKKDAGYWAVFQGRKEKELAGRVITPWRVTI